MSDLKEKLDKVVDEAVESAQKSVADYAGIAKEANAQLGADPPADAGTWLKLTAKVYARATTDAAKAWTTGLDVLQAVADEADSDDSDDSG